MSVLPANTPHRTQLLTRESPSLSSRLYVPSCQYDGGKKEDKYSPGCDLGGRLVNV